MVNAVSRAAMALLVVCLYASSPTDGWAGGVVATPVPRGVIEGAFDVGGRSLFLRCVGVGGPTVVFESGSDVTAEAWLPIQQALAPLTRSCAYDRANLGRSDPAAPPRRGTDVVEDLHRLLAAAAVPGPYVLVGASLGGLFVRLYAHAYPDEVVGMVLLDAMHEDLVDRFTALVDPEMIGPLTTALADRDDRESFVVDGLVPSALTDEVRAARRAAPSLEFPLAVITPGTFQVVAIDALPGWPAEQADALWADLQADLATLSPEGRLVVAEGSGHFVQGDRPALVVEAVSAIVVGAREPSPGATPTLTSCVTRRRS